MRIAICDDDPKASNSLYQDITKIAEEQLNTPQNTEPSLDPVMTRSDIFADPDELLFAAESEHYDLAFIDIELGDQSGIRLSNHLLRIHPDIQIIFFSGYDDYYLDVYNVDHVYFLKKPVDPERLKTALYAAQRKVLSLKDKFLTISNKQGVFRIPLQEILFLEKSRRLILVHTADGEVFKTYGDRKFLVSARAGLQVSIAHPLHGSAEGSSSPLYSPAQAIPISKTYYTQAREAFLKCLRR